MLPIYFAQNEVGPFVKTNIGNKSSLLLFVVVLFTLVSNSEPLPLPVSPFLFGPLRQRNKFKHLFSVSFFFFYERDETRR